MQAIQSSIKRVLLAVAQSRRPDSLFESLGKVYWQEAENYSIGQISVTFTLLAMPISLSARMFTASD